MAKAGVAAEHIKQAENQGIRAEVERPLKVVFLGAGSFFFQSLFMDVLLIPGARRGEMALVDIDEKRLALAQKMGEMMVQEAGREWTVTASTERKDVLAGADYIINCIEVSGLEAVQHDYEIPLKYGVDQCIGDTVGPGGLMKALRTVPVWVEVLGDIERLCPEAWVLNYTNPMSILCLAAARASRAKVVGLCHSVQGTSHQLAKYAGVAYRDMRWRCGGVNHLAWFTELTHKGEDLYPVLREKARQDKEVYEQDPVRFDMMLHFDYFVTESSGHFSEYLPYYRKREELITEYCREGFRGESGFYPRMWPEGRKNSDKARAEYIEKDGKTGLKRSWEYASYIIEARETNKAFVIHGTVPNTGLIENVPQDGVVEVACVVDDRGITPTYFGRLPGQCAALCDWNMRMYDMAATACLERSREAAIHALMLDPLTAAVCCPAEIKRMGEELFEAERALMPF